MDLLIWVTLWSSLVIIKCGWNQLCALWLVRLSSWRAYMMPQAWCPSYIVKLACLFLYKHFSCVLKSSCMLAFITQQCAQAYLLFPNHYYLSSDVTLLQFDVHCFVKPKDFDRNCSYSEAICWKRLEIFWVLCFRGCNQKYHSSCNNSTAIKIVENSIIFG